MGKVITVGKYFQQNFFPVTYPRLSIGVKKKRENSFKNSQEIL